MSRFGLPEILVLVVIGAILVALVWLFRRAFRDLKAAPAGPDGVRPWGVRGWLELFVILLYIGGVVRPLSYWLDFTDAERSYPQLLEVSGYPLYRTMSISLGVVLGVWSIVTAYSLKHKQTAHTVQHARYFLWAVAGYPVVLLLLTGTIKHDGLREFVQNNLYGIAFQSLLFAGIWYLYLAKSLRVRNTYLSDFGNEFLATAPLGAGVELALGVDRASASREISPRSSAESNDSARADAPADMESRIGPTIEARLESLKRLRDKGLISDADYESKKAALLGDL